MASRTPSSLSALSRGERRRRIVDQNALGDLQDQTGRVEAAGHGVAEIGDRNSSELSWKTLTLTATVRFLRCRCQDFAWSQAWRSRTSDALDEARLFGKRNEVRAGEPSPGGVAPADQSLHT